MSAWSIDELQRFAASSDLHISVLRRDGATYGTPTRIWSVVVEGCLFVRAYYGRHSRWYQTALVQKSGRVAAAGMTKEVHLEPVQGAIKDLIDEAYRAKYTGSPYLKAMLGTQARAATLRADPV